MTKDEFRMTKEISMLNAQTSPRASRWLLSSFAILHSSFSLLAESPRPTLPPEQRTEAMKPLLRNEALASFDLWREKADKTPY